MRNKRLLIAAILGGWSAAHAKMNVLLICVDDLRPELKSFGVDYIHSPNIDRLASTGRAFTRHYVQSPSCGPSRYTLLTGRYGPHENDALFQRAAALSANRDAFPPSMPEWFRNHGYTAVSVGKVFHHPGGLGGADWNDESAVEIPNAWDRHLMPSGLWKHPRGIMHGLANGELWEDPGKMDLFQSFDGPDECYPDALIAKESIAQQEALSGEEKPFHYWKDVVEHLAPAEMKRNDAATRTELPVVLKNNWITPTEQMNQDYLEYIVKEKDYGVRLAEAVVKKLATHQSRFADAALYADLYQTANRSYLSARLRRGAAKVYFASRITPSNPWIDTCRIEGQKEIDEVCPLVDQYSFPYPKGEYDWKKDSDIARSNRDACGHSEP